MVVHKESIHIEQWKSECLYWRLSDAKKELAEHRTCAQGILQLNDEGAGSVIWVRKEQKEELVSSLARWSGCYGKWPVKELNV